MGEGEGQDGSALGAEFVGLSPQPPKVMTRQIPLIKKGDSQGLRPFFLGLEGSLYLGRLSLLGGDEALIDMLFGYRRLGLQCGHR